MTRALSVMLEDDESRASLYRALRDSPYREGKRHFRTLISDGDGALRNALASAVGKTTQGLEILLDSVIDLEIYLPVPEHRDAWRGDRDLIVAFAAEDDGSAPIGFALGAKKVLLSAETPPATPTIVLTAVETDFSRTPGPGASPAAGDPAMMVTEGVWMTKFSIEDDYGDYDGWPRGAPEFEIHTFVEDSNGDLAGTACSGEYRSGDRYWNYDAESVIPWGGNVLLATKAQLTAGEGAFGFHVWENDWDKCDDNGGGIPPRTYLEQAENIAINATLIPEGNWIQDVISYVVQAWEWLLIVPTSGYDDHVGVMFLPPVQCWSDGVGPVPAPFYSEGDEDLQTGSAFININFGDREPICDLTVGISGPTSIETCENWIVPDPDPDYSANVSGGSGTISYEWVEDGVSSGTSSTYTLSDWTEGEHTLELYVQRGSDYGNDAIVIDVEEVSCSGGGF